MLGSQEGRLAAQTEFIVTSCGSRQPSVVLPAIPLSQDLHAGPGFHAAAAVHPEAKCELSRCGMSRKPLEHQVPAPASAATSPRLLWPHRGVCLHPEALTYVLVAAVQG